MKSHYLLVALTILLIVPSELFGQYPQKSIDNFTLRKGRPGNFYHAPNRFDNSADFEEYVYWERSGPNPWQVTGKINFRLMKPNNYNSNRSYPLLLHFTGCGEMGRVKCSTQIPLDDPDYDGNDRQLGFSNISFGGVHVNAVRSGRFNGIVVALQGDYEGWDNGFQNPASPTMVMVIKTLEEIIKNFPVDPNRVYLEGLSNGGKAVWDLAMRRPDLITAITPFSAVGGNSMFDQLAHMPIWQFQGEVDRNPPASASRGLRNYFLNNGAEEYRYTEYAGVGHGVWTGYSWEDPDFFEWFLRKDQRNLHVFFDNLNINNGGGKMQVAPGFKSYIWYHNDVVIPNANSNQFDAKYGGRYKVRYKRFDNSYTTSFEVNLSGPNGNYIPNRAPVVAVGGNITTTARSVNLSANASDPDGDDMTFLWSKVSGPNANENNRTTTTLALSNLEIGTYVYRFTATDQSGLNDFDDITLTVNKDGGGGGGQNTTPVANAGPDRTIDTASTTLNGSGSDEDGDNITYNWYKFSGPGATLTNRNRANLSLSNLFNGTYKFRLQVKDPSGKQNTDEMVLVVNKDGGGGGGNSTPVANAGPDRTINTASTSIIGSGTDADGDALTYNWYKYSGPGATLFNKNTRNLGLSNLFNGTYRFRLQVKDPSGKQNTDEMTLVVDKTGGGVGNSTPVANAGPDRTINTASTTINGSGNDADGDALTYNWYKYSGPGATLFNKNTRNLGLSNLFNGTYRFRLQVKDPSGKQNTDEMILVVDKTGNGGGGNANGTPIANAGPDRTITTNSATIVGSASDPDGDPITIKWYKYSGPGATLSNTNQTSLNVSNLYRGTYRFRMKVTDSKGAQKTDEMILVYGLPPAPPLTIDDEYIIRLNFGGGEVQSSIGEVWTSDVDDNAAYLLSESKSARSSETEFDNWSDAPVEIFNTYRTSALPMKMAFDLDPGKYELSLYFAEPELAIEPGERKFDVMLNQNLTNRSLDVAGLFYKGGLQMNYQIETINGSLHLDILPVIGHGFISGLAVKSLDEKANAEVEVFPNPFERSVLVDVGTFDMNLVEFELRNQIGQSIMIEEKSYLNGKVRLTFADKLAPGLYHLFLKTGSGLEMEKLIKR